jgi:hypothetical protein
MSRSRSYETGYDVTPAEAFRGRNGLGRLGAGEARHELWHDPWADGTRVYDIVATERLDRTVTGELELGTRRLAQRGMGKAVTT